MGLAELVRRNGDVTKIHCDVVRENDEFEYDMGEISTHKYKFNADRGEVIAAYAMVQFKDGAKQVEVMSLDEINKIRNSSQGKNQKPWTQHFDEMAKKTVFRRLSKWLTLSPEIRDSIDKIDSHDFTEMKDITPKSASLEEIGTQEENLEQYKA